MKLRSQLILLVAGAAFLFLISVAAYFVILSPLDTMQKEVGAFQEMSRATAALQAEANQLALKPFGAQRTVFDDAVNRFHAAQEGMKAVVLLPQVNETLAGAVEATANLGELSETSLTSLTDALDELKTITTARTPFDTTDYSTMVRLAASGELDDAASTSLATNTLATQLVSLNEALTVTRQVVEQKDGEISAELEKIRGTSSLVGLSVILLAVGGSLVVSMILARNITRSLKTLGSTVARVGEGDLRVRFASGRKDELGALGRDIDAFLDTLTSAFRRIQAASDENLSVKDQLSQSVGSATASATQIEANSSSILAQLQRADDRIQSSESDLNNVVILLEAFRVRLGKQDREVAAARSTVAELAQGIQQISALSDENRSAVEALLNESDRGREVFDRSFSKVAEISESVSAIQDLVGAIADIASQTNILALNAAIEAAHAGEAGKGFAVVSDEIGKLAAASAESSAQIAKTIDDVVAKINEAGATREETIGAFNAIGAQIGTVSERGRGIHAETANMNQSTHRIREVMDSLSASSKETTGEADRISSLATSLGDAIGQVGRISHEVVSNIGEITQGLAEISRTVGEVQAQSERLGRAGATLDEAVNAFQTENDSVE